MKIGSLSLDLALTKMATCNNEIQIKKVEVDNDSKITDHCIDLTK